MSILNKEYELSVWNEELVDGIKKESKGTIIGASGMTHLGRATAPKLVRSVKGTNTLTFQMPTKYFDSEKGEYVKNELLEDLYNERKLKLYYDGKWYEFYIKNLQEDKQYKSIMKTITCVDSFIDELSRTGYEVEFSSELNNSVEEIGTFMETKEEDKIRGSSKAILDDSVWDYRPEMNIGDFTEFKEQRFYKIPLKQFGGKITGYKINLEVDEEDFKTGTQKEKEQKAYLRNPYTQGKRPLQYGDDQARVEELFYDPYETDNGHILLDKENMVELSGDYIYVPITDLSFIMGSLYSNSTKAIEEPALFGNYMNKGSKYALQPASKNPSDLIQFIFFDENSIIEINENGVVTNNNYHYVIKISEWNEILEKNINKTAQINEEDEGVIYWTSPTHDSAEDVSTYALTTKYETAIDNNVRYSKNVRPDTRTIDDFCWYPVYYDGYLDKIDDIEVGMARKISIADRTELNLKDDIYVTVYKNKASEFEKNLYSEEEVAADNSDKNNEFNDYRITSKLETRIVLPTLARNLVENGQKITDSTGWEAMTQNYNDENLGVGSYKKVMELSVKSTVNLNNEEETSLTIDNTTGSNEDEKVTDYFLEILSPCIDKTEDLSYEGEIETDYALNFGIVGQKKKIEKDKVYAIRMITGKWITDNYSFTNRSDSSSAGEFSEKEFEAYKASISDFKNLLIALEQGTLDKKWNNYSKIHSTLKEIKLPADTDKDKNDKYKEIEETLKDLMFGQKNSIISIHDKNVTKEYLKWKNLLVEPVYEDAATTSFNTYTKDTNISDIKYLKYTLFTLLNKIDAISTTITDFFYAVRISGNITDSWINSFVSENKHFEKGYNLDLHKVIIGSGATNSQGNYVVDGIDGRTNDENETVFNYISFEDLADTDNLEKLTFIPKSHPTEKSDSTYLTTPLYYNKTGTILKEKWVWSDIKDENISQVEDNSFVLFKAKRTIENPYIAIRVDSAPAQINFDSIQEKTYIENNGSGVRIEIVVPGEDVKITADLETLLHDGFEYVNNCLVEVYAIGSTADNSYNCFSDDFCQSVGYNKDDGTIALTKNNIVKNRQYGELKDGDLNPNSPWKDYSSTSAPLYDTAIAGQTTTADKSFGYALFVNNVYYGVFWFEKDKGGA